MNIKEHYNDIRTSPKPLRDLAKISMLIYIINIAEVKTFWQISMWTTIWRKCWTEYI